MRGPQASRPRPGGGPRGASAVELRGPGGRTSRCTTNVWDPFTILPKSHSSWPFGRPKIPFSAKSCVTGPRGSSCRSGLSGSGPPLRTERRSDTIPPRGSSRFSSHLTCTRPLPLARLKDAPPLRSSTTLGRSIILNLPGAMGTWKAGETATLSLAFNLRASTVHETQKDPPSPSSMRTAVCVVTRSSSGCSTVAPSVSAGALAAGQVNARLRDGTSGGASQDAPNMVRSCSSSWISACRSAGRRLHGGSKSAASESSEVAGHVET
mmetsp:Transcript_21788/g.61904  ORF Transcript_21788/g.61904 Transcript_21788/m.61904 type:complete len:266 (+) Transcript_21788:216-1013(+)